MDTHTHSADSAILDDGACKGQSVGIEPGQTTLVVADGELLHYYAYECMTSNRPDTAVFVAFCTLPR